MFYFMKLNSKPFKNIKYCPFPLNGFNFRNGCHVAPYVDDDVAGDVDNDV